MKPRTGQQLASTVDDTQIVVVRAPDAEVTITCGGAGMVDPNATETAPRAVADPEQQSGTQLGKRYAHEEIGIEVLVTKAGRGTLAVDGVPLAIKGAKLLPSSD
ncbi:hypothetical protein ACIHDR_24170 [Nocardia sp. NPDC052278]|uniref:hypothetical protein n=1 Tax=unclassified Nocardia TaxID=2637762 RepID=UPI0036A2A5BE